MKKEKEMLFLSNVEKKVKEISFFPKHEETEAVAVPELQTHQGYLSWWRHQYKIRAHELCHVLPLELMLMFAVQTLVFDW